MTHILLKFLSFIVSRMSISLRYKVGLLLGKLCWPIIPYRRKQMAYKNIIAALDVAEEEAYLITKESAVRFGPMFLEVLALPAMNSQNIDQFVSFEGKENLVKALSAGNGAILATAHSGNWELLGASLAMNGFPLVAVVQKQTNKSMDCFINEIRKNAGMQMAYKQEVRDMLRILGEGKLLGLLIDQDAHKFGAFVEFFGRVASTPQGAAVFARLKGVPVVPAFITQIAPGRHKVIIQKPIIMTKTANREADIFNLTQTLTRVVEQYIKQKPAEWFWLHNRWKTKKSD